MSHPHEKLVLIIAGEASADLHGSNLVLAMKRQDPDISFCGIGGQKMEAAGVKILFPSSKMAVVGITEVFSRLSYILKAYRQLKKMLTEADPDLIILIDYPDFNIRLAGVAKRYGVPVLYYISPQVWAWRKGRIKTIADRVDRMSVILPFEGAYYEQCGLRTDYVGHPLMDSVPQGLNPTEVKLELGLHCDGPVLGLLPGSRVEEIKNLLPAMVEAAEILSLRHKGLTCILPLASTVPPGLVEAEINHSPVNIKLIQGKIYEALVACDAAMLASGTVTLEAAILGTPMIIAYRVSPLSYWIGKMVVKVPFIGLVNLVAEKAVVPELIQNQVTPDRLAEEADAILKDGPRRKNMIEDLEMVKERLGPGGASEKTAKVAIGMMAGN